MTVTMLHLNHDAVCACGAFLPRGTRAGWQHDSDSAVCTDCLYLAAQVGDAPPLEIVWPEAS